MFADAAYGAVVLANPYTQAATVQRTDVLGEHAARSGKAACYVSFSQWLEGPGLREAEANPHVAVYRSFRHCYRALAAWQWREGRRQRVDRQLHHPLPPDAAARAALLLRAGTERTLTEREAKEVLSLYRVPVVPEVLAQTGDAAVDAARNLGWPVVMKVESPDLPHKTEAGVVRLNLADADADAVASAYDEILANATRVSPPPRVHGVLVQPMVCKGVEVMVGARIDPLFGPLVVVGSGGILVELLNDTAVAPAPVTHDEALEMLRSLKVHRLLAGFRGSEPVDLDRVAAIICRISTFAADQRDHFVELDVNPLICSARRITAVDALIVRRAE